MVLGIFYKVQSHIDPRKIYTVVRKATGEYSCECPHFAIHNRRIGICKHIREVMMKNKAIEEQEKEDLKHWEEVGLKDETAREEQETRTANNY